MLFSVFGAKSISQLLVPENVVRHVVVTVDNLPRKTVAVLPFANVGGDTANAYFADGLTDDLASTLARTGKLRVAARSSAYSFKGRSALPADVGKQLNVVQMPSPFVFDLSTVGRIDGLAIKDFFCDFRSKHFIDKDYYGEVQVGYRCWSEKVLTVKTTESEGHAAAGVFLGTSFDFPTKVSINAGDVGGPSAGMMFSLAIYDKLTPGALTGGAKIAGTGTINSAGEVGAIGGIQQKLVGAKRGGAEWFLAPAANCDEVVGHVPDGLQVVKVATFAQARDAVEAIGTKRPASLPRCA
jgi:hypothetical protein